MQIPQPRTLNSSQQMAIDMVLKEQRKLTFIQGPPGTGKTTTAIEIICGWIAMGKGPILATAFSNKGMLWCRCKGKAGFQLQTPPKLGGGGGVREMGSIDRTINQLL